MHFKLLRILRILLIKINFLTGLRYNEFQSRIRRYIFQKDDIAYWIEKYRDISLNKETVFKNVS